MQGGDCSCGHQSRRHILQVRHAALFYCYLLSDHFVPAIEISVMMSFGDCKVINCKQPNALTDNLCVDCCCDCCTFKEF